MTVTRRSKEPRGLRAAWACCPRWTLGGGALGALAIGLAAPRGDVAAAGPERDAPAAPAVHSAPGPAAALVAGEVAPLADAQ